MRLELDNKGFIRARHILDAAPSAGASTQDHGMAAFNAATNFPGLMGQACQEVKCDPRARVADRWLGGVEPEPERRAESPSRVQPVERVLTSRPPYTMPSSGQDDDHAVAGPGSAVNLACNPGGTGVRHAPYSCLSTSYGRVLFDLSSWRWPGGR